MTLFKAVIEHMPVNNLPKDIVVNTLHFDIDGSIPPALDGITQAIRDFYRVPAGGAATAPSSYMSNLLSTATRTTMYNMTDPKPRVPVRIDDFLINRGPSALPSEVALVCSFHGQIGSGTIAARRRNRIYFGPMSVNANSNGVPATGLVTSLVGAMVGLKAAGGDGTGWQWRGYSPTAQQDYGVVGGWVDNAFDTQRRRGGAPTTRTLWVPAPD